MTQPLSSLRLVLIVGLTGLLAACGTTHTDEDAAIVLDDTGPGDAGVDAGPSSIGQECGSDGDCPGDNTTCVTDLPGGYCSAFCDTSEQCPAGSVCLDFGGGTALCTQSCDPTAADQCRPGYGCASGIMSPVCLPGCEDDSDCGSGTECNPEAGVFSGGAGECFTPGSSLGDACGGSTQCPSGAFCFEERRFALPGGYCGGFGCDVASNTGCPDGGVCLPGGRGGRCYLGCDAPEDCGRAEYDCRASVEYPERSYCFPDDIGQVCSNQRGACGGTCLSEAFSGWPDSACVEFGCDPEATESGCPGDAVCAPIAADGGGVCIDDCDAPADCRDGYACRPSDPEDETSATGCLPGCESSAVCGNDGFECNLGTGRCTEPFDDANLGEPCVGLMDDGTTDCPGGRCLDEANDGYPAGMCALGGCRLSGEGPMTECPSGSACVDDESGDPTLGVCAPSCTTDASSCRPGYACEPFEPAGTDGACQPMCESDSCGGGRTCDTESGLCQ